MEMNKKTTIGAALLASTLGIGVGRLTATPPTPEVRLVGVSIDPIVALTVAVGGQPKRIQCADVNGPTLKLNGQDFPQAKDLCDAVTKFAVSAKTGVSSIADAIAQPPAAKAKTSTKVAPSPAKK